MFKLRANQAQTITFVMIDSAGIEVPGLGAGYTMQIAKGVGPFVPATGVQAEISAGWYSYGLTALETDTTGPLSFAVNGAGCIQQNLMYLVEEATIGLIRFTYTLTDSVSLLPIDGANIWVTTDPAGNNIIWAGFTDAFGVARDAGGNLPWLPAGQVYFFRTHPGYDLSNNPDIETVS